MLDTFLQKNVFFQWLSWYLIEMPIEILKAWKNILVFNLNYFSINLLFKTLFSYWHQYQWSYPRGFDLAKYLEVAFSNLLSRFLGAIVRLVIIALGLLIEISIFFAGIVVFLAWFLMPLLALLAFGKGFNLLI